MCPQTILWSEGEAFFFIFRPFGVGASGRFMNRPPLVEGFYGTRSPVPAGSRVAFFTGLKKVTKESAY
jgi:hypothetical protein